jgi:hypothetical protein
MNCGPEIVGDSSAADTLAANLVAGMVGVSGENGQGAVYLLGQNNTGELMRQSHATKGKKQVGTLACGRRPPIRRSDGKHQPLNTLVADAAEVRGELIRAVLLAAAIHQNRIRRSATGLAIQPIEQGRFGVEELGLTRDISGRTPYVVGEQAVRSF